MTQKREPVRDKKNRVKGKSAGAKQSERGLPAPERDFKRLVEGLNEGYFVIQDFKVVLANPRSTEMFGYCVEEVIGRSIEELLKNGAMKQPLEWHKKRLRGEDAPTQYEITLPRKDGAKRTVEFAVRRTSYMGKPAVAVMIRDITNRRIMDERACQESEARYRLLAENVSDVIFTMDMELHATYISPSITRQRGYTVEEAMKLVPTQILTPRSLENVSTALAEEIEMEKTGQKDPSRSRTLELEVYHKDGSTLWAEIKVVFLRDEDGKPAGILGVSRDITKRKKIEEDLQKAHEELDRRVEERTAELVKANEQLRQEIVERKRIEEELRVREKAIENSINAISITDIDGNITYVNKSGLNVWGGDNKKELIGRHFSELLGPDEAIRDMAKKIRESGYWEGELIGKRKDGTEIQVEVLASIVKDEQGNPVQTISSFIDVTGRKNTEEQLQLAGRLAAVGELAAGVAHELSNPLAAIQGFAQLLAARKDLDKSIREDVEAIYSEAKRAGRITGNLLSFARRHHPEKSLISINDALEKSLELHAYRMKVNNIEVWKNLDPDLPMTMADFYQMQEVFVNLLTNAEQAMTEASGRGKLLVRTRKAGDMIRISFIDDGPGIPEEDLKRLFDPFFTTKEAGRGTGLGLSICYGLVESHGGHIYVKSMSGRGANFTVEIPIVAEGQNGNR